MIGRVEVWLEPEDNGLVVPVSAVVPNTDDVPSTAGDNVGDDVVIGDGVEAEYDDISLEAEDVVEGEVEWEDEELDESEDVEVDVDVSNVVVDRSSVDVVEALTVDEVKVADADDAAATEASDAAEARTDAIWV